MKASVYAAKRRFLEKYSRLGCVENEIDAAFEILRACAAQGGCIFTAGNGGSAADSGHITGELMKGFLLPRRMSRQQQELFSCSLPEDDALYLSENLQCGIPALSLCCHHELISAVANDNGADLVFAQQVFAMGKPCDALIVLSTSGNSENVVRAAQTAKAMGIPSIAVTGEGGGKLLSLCNITIRLPSRATTEIQEMTLPLYHVLCEMLELEFFGKEE